MAAFFRFFLAIGILLFPLMTLSQSCNFEIEEKDPFTFDYTFLTQAMPLGADTNIAVTCQGYFKGGRRYLRLNILSDVPLSVRRGNLLQVKISGDTTDNKPRIIELESAVYRYSDHILQSFDKREVSYNLSKIWLITVDYYISENKIGRLAKEPVAGLRIFMYGNRFDLFPEPETAKNMNLVLSCIKNPVEKESAKK